MLISIAKKGQLYFIFSFAAMIIGGMLILKLPFLYRPDGSLPWLDAIFTATSAVCVTGLTTVPTSSFTWPGQLVLLLLIQLGGIGIMTLTTSVLLAMGHKLSFGDTLMMSNLSERYTLRGTENLTRTVVNYTLFCEAVGTLILFPGFRLEGLGVMEALWQSIFHSVSAFCNAGFSPYDQSLIGQNAWIKLTVAAIIILGGLGVYVVYDIRMALHFRQRLHAQSKLILYTTAVLLLFGMVGFWGFQLAENLPITWVDAFFQSATARTAGFNSIPMAQMTGSSITLMIILMQIGASPGSTGGGIKTTTVALAAAALVNTFKGNGRVLIFKREIPQSNVLKAFSLIVTYVVLACFGALMLEGLTPCSTQWAFFEAASALSTVGIALDNPEPLTAAAKIFIILYMFIGRVGLFTVFLFLLGRERRSRLTYPEERVIVS